MMGVALLIGGAVMWAVDALCRQPKILHMEEMGFLQAIFVGLAQILSAAFPGTSRSMATIAAGQATGMSRAAALEFSFFLSMPTMFAATAYKLHKPLLKPDAAIAMTGHNWIILAIGFATSFLVAWAVVAWFMHWVRRHGFALFAVYRIVAGVGILVWMARR
jgi:undecaprenyl-diphosphatase